MNTQRTADAHASFERGKKKFERGNFRAAADEFSAAIRLDPDLAEAYQLRGEAKWELKNYPGAVADYNKAIKLRPGYIHIFYESGIAQIARRDFRKAVSELTKAVFLMPNEPEAYIGRGTAKAYIKDYQGAIGDYTKAIDLRPDHADSYYIRGNIRTIMQNYTGAVADYTKALDLRPDHADAVRDRELALKLLTEQSGEKMTASGGTGRTVFQKSDVRLKGLLAIVVTPPDAQVFVDGTECSGRQTVVLRRGRRSILVRKEGYEDLKEKVMIPAGGILLRKYVLEKRPIMIDAEETTHEDRVLPEIPFSTGEFVYVEGGRFEMGGSGQSDEKPVHPVVIAGFEIAKYPVTQRLWRDAMGYDVSAFKGDSYPVENVSWNDAQEFILKLNGWASGYSYRLPTEAEWEYAARGGSLARAWIYSGSDSPHEVSWNLENSQMATHEVGTKKPNDLGLYDMSGNVWEWCQDWYSNEYYSVSPRSNPWGPGWGTDRVLRGGSWLDSVDNCRVSVRSLNYPGRRNIGNGFRLVRIRADAK